MRHTTLRSLTAAVFLAACHDATAPERSTEPQPVPHTTALARVDSTAVWASMALDDAATRLLSALAEGEARSELIRALRALSIDVVAPQNEQAARGHYEAASRTLAQLLRSGEASALADLDAVGFALDHAGSLIGALVDPNGAQRARSHK